MHETTTKRCKTTTEFPQKRHKTTTKTRIETTKRHKTTRKTLQGDAEWTKKMQNNPKEMHDHKKKNDHKKMH